MYSPRLNREGMKIGENCLNNFQVASLRTKYEFFSPFSSTFKRVFHRVNSLSVKFRGRRVAKTIYFDRNILRIRKFLENRGKLLFERNMNSVFTSIFFFFFYY